MTPRAVPDETVLANLEAARADLAAARADGEVDRAGLLEALVEGGATC